MKKLVIFSLISLLSIHLLSAQTADSNNNQLRLFGIGVGFQTSDLDLYNWISGSNLIFTINIDDDFRLEPEFGYSKHKSDHDGVITEWKNFVFALNSSLVILKEDVCITPGIKLGFAINRGYNEYPTGEESNWKGNSFIIGPIIGLEYLISEHFSIGGELGLIFSSMEADETWDNSPYTKKQSLTTAEVKFRFYF